MLEGSAALAIYHDFGVMDPRTMFRGAVVLAVEVSRDFVEMLTLQSRGLSKNVALAWTQLESKFQDSYILMVPKNAHLLIFSGEHTRVYLAPVQAPLEFNLDDIIEYRRQGDTGAARAGFQCTGHRSHSMSGARKQA